MWGASPTFAFSDKNPVELIPSLGAFPYVGVSYEIRRSDGVLTWGGDHSDGLNPTWGVQGALTLKPIEKLGPMAQLAMNFEPAREVPGSIFSNSNDAFRAVGSSLTLAPGFRLWNMYVLAGFIPCGPGSQNLSV